MTLNVMNPKSAPTRHPEMRSLGNFEILETTYQVGSNMPKHMMLKALQKHTKPIVALQVGCSSTACNRCCNASQPPVHS